MSVQEFLNDPAIIGLSSPSTSHTKYGAPATRQGLEPGSALSKLLDSAMANAAKEVSPEPEKHPVVVLDRDPKSISDRSPFEDFIPEGKCDLSKVYSINFLLGLRSNPAVLEFDTSSLPEASFWRAKSKDGISTNGKNNSHNNNNSGHSSSGTGKRGRRNAQLANTAVSDSLNWERKPAGFLKQPDFEHMSTEKISQLLGEAPEEELPDWDLPVIGSDSRIQMGNTVEDFERWKVHMRQEEKRKHGEAAPSNKIQDAASDSASAPAPANEVDNFFSFVDSKEPASDSAVYALNKHIDNKNSRFSSFFQGSASTPEEPRTVSQESDISKSARSNLKGEISAGSSRFFNGDSNVNHSPPTHSSDNQKKPQERHSHGPPPGMHSNFQAFNAGPQINVAHGLPPQLNPPPGFHMHSGPPQALGMPVRANPRGPPTNDSFFFSLLNKNEGLPNVDGASPLVTFSRQAVSSGEGVERSEELREVPRPGHNPGNAPPNHPPQFSSYQDAPRGMCPHPGGQIPPGMFPLGMIPPGSQGIHSHGQNYCHQGQHTLPVQHNHQEQNGSGSPNTQLQGDILPPWMRFGPHGPTGSMPSGFNHLPPGFPPGFARGPPGNRLPPQSHQGQQKQT